MARKCLIIKNNLRRRASFVYFREFVVLFLRKTNALDFNSFVKNYFPVKTVLSRSIESTLKEKGLSFEHFLSDSTLCKHKDIKVIYKRIKKSQFNISDRMKFCDFARKLIKSHPNKVTNRCLITGRNNSIGLLGVSRVQVRHLHALGNIPGLLKH